MSPEQNHYEFLGADVFASRAELEASAERLSKQANALANVSPERSHQIRERLRQVRTDLLSDDDRRRAYDRVLLADRRMPSHSGPEAGVTIFREDGVPRDGRGQSGSERDRMDGSVPRRRSFILWAFAGALAAAILGASGSFVWARTHAQQVAAATATPLPATHPTSTPSLTAQPTQLATPTLAPPSSTPAPPNSPTPIPTVTPPPGTGGPLYEASWSNGISDWPANPSGTWSAAGGTLSYDGTGKGAILAPYATPLDGYAVEATMRPGTCTGTKHGIGLYLRASSNVADTSGILAGSWNDGAIIWTATDPHGGNYALVPYPLQIDWHTYRAEVRASRITLLVDGTPVVSATVPEYQSLTRAGPGASHCAVQVQDFKIVSLP